MEIREIVIRSQQGDLGAQEELYQQTNQRAYFLALKLLHNQEDAMDIVQDSYIAAFQGLEKLEKPESFFSWFSQIVANRCKNQLRMRKRYTDPVSDEDFDTDFMETIEDTDENILPESMLDKAETRRLILQIIDDLPDEQRECIMLLYFSNLSVEQIATLQGCSTGTVKSRLNYARKKIKESILLFEEKEGVRLHALMPIGMVFSHFAAELPAQLDFQSAWKTISAGIGAGTAAGTIGTAAGATAGTTKTGILSGIKIKIAAVLSSAAIVASAVVMVLHADPLVTFQSPAFEAAFAEAADLTVGEIHESDLEQVDSLIFYEDKVYLDKESLPEEIQQQSPYLKILDNAAQGYPEMDLVDLSLFPALDTLELNFITVRNEDVLKQCDLHFLEITGASLQNWDSIASEGIRRLDLIMPDISQGTLDFSKMQNLQALDITMKRAEDWSQYFTGFGALKKLRRFAGMTYEGTPDFSDLAQMEALEFVDLKVGGAFDLHALTDNKKLRSIYVAAGTDEQSIEVLDELPALEAIGLQHAKYFLLDGHVSTNQDMIERHIAIWKQITREVEEAGGIHE